MKLQTDHNDSHFTFITAHCRFLSHRALQCCCLAYMQRAVYTTTLLLWNFVTKILASWTSEKLLKYMYYLLYLDDLYSFLCPASGGCCSWCIAPSVRNVRYATLQLRLVVIISARRSFFASWTSLATGPTISTARIFLQRHLTNAQAAAAAAAAADSDVTTKDDDANNSGKLQSVAGCSGRMSRHGSLHYTISLFTPERLATSKHRTSWYFVLAPEVRLPLSVICICR